MNLPQHSHRDVRTHREVLQYAWRARRNPLQLVFVLILAAGVLWQMNPQAYSTLTESWGDRVEPFIGITTLVVAGMVWWGELAEDWLASLPKRLHAVFLFDDEEIMRCNYAKLSSESDIRQLGQQIGSQLLTSMSTQHIDEDGTKTRKPVMLTFRAASIDYTSIGPHRLPESPALGEAVGQICNLYEVRYELLGKRPAQCREGDCLIWDPPFDAPRFASDKPAAES